MKKTFFFFLFLMNYLLVGAQYSRPSLLTSNTINYPHLQTGFVSPPKESTLRCYWWWLNSMSTKASITRDLEQMKLNGYGGASIVDAGSNYVLTNKSQAGPVFMSAPWMELYKHAVKEAERIGIELSVNIQSGWNPGGPTITPELAMKKMVFTETNIQGGKEIQIKLPQPETKLFYQDIIIQAIKVSDPLTKTKDDAIKNWGLKSFNKDFGGKGRFLLDKLRESFSDSVQTSIILKNDIIDLTAKFKNGILIWQAPKGNWTIIRYGMTCTGAKTSTNSDGWEGLSLDHLNPDAFNKFSKDVIVPLINTAKQAGNSVHYLQTDSWEMKRVGWTNNFAAEFKKFRGYDMTPFMPVLAGRVVESVDQSDRFLHDYRLTIGDCVAKNHYQLFSDLAHKNGLGIHPESGGPHSAPIDALSVMAISEFPQGEFWATSNTHRVSDDERLFVKQSACVAHTNGKKIVAAEGPTSIGPQWERSPKDLKSNIDRVFCSGLNRIVWHTFTSSPKEFGLPGNEYFAGTHMNPNITWWKQAGSFINYLNRCSYLLSQGLFVADVLYYYGDDVPNFVFNKADVNDLAFGHDWDKCSKEVIINRAAVNNKKLVLPDGMNYRLLILPNENAIDINVLRKIEQLVKAGLTVIAPRPIKATGLTNFPSTDKEVVAIATRLWGSIDGKKITENKYGNGRVIWGVAINSVLNEMHIQPDFEFTSNQPNTGLDYIHRTSKEMEIYFVANLFDRAAFSDFKYRYITSLPDRYEQVGCKFRVTGMQPELWDPITGISKEITTYSEENGQTIIPLNFEPGGSKFIIFKKPTNSNHIVSIQKNGQSIFSNNSLVNANKTQITIDKKNGQYFTTVFEPGNYQIKWLNGKVTTSSLFQPNQTQSIFNNWTLKFDTAWGGPSFVKIDTLKSWTEFSDLGIKYYSGTAVYANEFAVTSAQLKDKKIILDLGNVLEMASIIINGNKIAVKWNAPYQFDISKYIHDGNNQLEVTVVNLWPNRLIGDSKLPVNQRRTKTNVLKYEAADAETLLRPSGLLGPVNLLFLQYGKIQN